MTILNGTLSILMMADPRFGSIASVRLLRFENTQYYDTTLNDGTTHRKRTQNCVFISKFGFFGLLAGSRVRCSSPSKSNLSPAAASGDGRISVRRRSRDSGPVRWAKRTGSSSCSSPTVGYVPGCRVPCGCGPLSCSPICSSGWTNGSADERGRTLWDCTLRMPGIQYTHVGFRKNEKRFTIAYDNLKV